MFEVNIKNMTEKKKKDHSSGLGFWWQKIIAKGCPKALCRSKNKGRDPPKCDTVTDLQSVTLSLTSSLTQSLTSHQSHCHWPPICEYVTEHQSVTLSLFLQYVTSHRHKFCFIIIMYFLPLQTPLIESQSATGWCPPWTSSGSSWRLPPYMDSATSLQSRSAGCYLDPT